MLVESKLEADTSAKKRSDKIRLIKTTNSPIVSIGSPTIGDVSNLRARNQALIGCFQGFAWLKAAS